MQRKTIARLVSTVVAIPLAITTLSTTALADDPTQVTSWTPADENVDSVGATAPGEIVTYTGDVTTSDETAVTASNGGGVNVIGNVSESVSSTGNGAPIISVDNGSVNIAGSVLIPESSPIRNATAVEFRGNSSVNISYPDSVIQGGTEVVAIYLDSDTHNGSFTANSSIEAHGSSIVIHAANGVSGIDETNIEDYLPQINVYKISGDANPGVYVYGDEFGVTDYDTELVMQDKVLHSINYIVHQDPLIVVDANNPSTGNATIIDSIRSLTTKYVSPSELASNPNAGFLAFLNSDYDLQVENNTNNAIALVTPLDTVRSDGSKVYRVVLTSTYGGLTLKAIRKQIAEATGVSESQVSLVVETPSSQNSDPAPSAPSEIPSGAVVVSTPAAGTPAAAPAVSGAEAPSRAVSLNITKLTPVQYQNAIVENVASTPAGTTFRVTTDRIACFDRKIISAFQANPNVSVEVLFPFGNQMLRVVIPRGYDVTKLLDEKGYCGFLRLASILGAEAVR